MDSILLSELLKDQGYSILGIRIIVRSDVFIASSRLSKNDESCTVFIYPCRTSGPFDMFPDIHFNDAVLERRTSESTCSVYYCWKELLSGELSFSVSGDVFVPSEPFGNVLSYPSALLNSGLLYLPDERSELINSALISNK